MADVTLQGIDTWTPEERNLIKAACSLLLNQQGITHDGISVAGSVVTITNPNGTLDGLTTNAIKTQIDQVLADAATAATAAAQETAARDTEIASSEFKQLRIAQVDAKIDAISSMADAKVFLKKLCRFLIARGVGDI